MKYFNTMKSEDGVMTIVEAAFVFPIMFFIVFIMIMCGEAYYQYAQVENAAVQAAVGAAARCENPMLKSVQDTGSVPTSTTASEVYPYRYILTGEAKSISSQAADDLRTKIGSMKPLLFMSMVPTNISVTMTPHLNVFVSRIDTKCSFEVAIPFRMIFSNKQFKFKYSLSFSEPVGDPSEFVRNVSMISDIIERSDTASSFASKVKEKAAKIGVILN